MIYQGMVIRATELLNHTGFEGSVILISEVNEKGAIGFILNRSYGRSLNELEEFKDARPVPLYEGGPVEDENIYFIHQRPDLVEGGTPLNLGFYVGGDFAEAINCVNNGSIALHQLRIFVGYCGWNKGELEAEVNEGSWEVLTSPDKGSSRPIFFTDLINSTEI